MLNYQRVPHLTVVFFCGNWWKAHRTSGFQVLRQGATTGDGLWLVDGQGSTVEGFLVQTWQNNIGGMTTSLIGGLEHFLFFHILGIIIPTDEHIFQRGWNHQLDPTKLGCVKVHENLESNGMFNTIFSCFFLDTPKMEWGQTMRPGDPQQSSAYFLRQCEDGSYVCLDLLMVIRLFLCLLMKSVYTANVLLVAALRP